MSAYRNPTNGRFIARDGLANLVTGAGTTADKRVHGFYTRPYILPEQIEAAYRSSWMMRKGIDLPPFDMTRNGRDWQMDEADVAKIEKEEKRLGLWSKLRQGLVLGRLGGGLIVMGIGNENPEKPVGDTQRSTGSLRYLHVMNRWQVSLGQIVMDPANDLFGQPAYFEINFGAGSTKGQVKIHPSRVIAFRGKQNPNLYGSLGDDWFWGDPLMLTVQDTVKNADAAMNGFASLIDEAKLDTVTIPGLTQLVATTEGEALLIKRVTIANQLKSSHNTRILDGGRGKDSPGETWETRQVTWAGMPDMIRVYAAAVAGAFDIPATRFLGKSPDGMNATGTGDEANYIAKIRADQDNDLRPALDQIDAVLLPSAGVNVTEESWYDFPPLQEMSELDKATIFKTRMEGVTALQATNSIPAVAFDRALQNTAVEEQWLAGIDGALAEVPEGERFPSELAEQEPDPAVPNTPAGKGGDRPPARDVADGGIPDTSLPFDDAFNPNQKRDDRGRWTSTGAKIQSHVRRALEPGNSHETTSLGKVSQTNVDLVRTHTGVDIDGHERVIASSEIRHAMKSHGDPVKEAARGQVQLAPPDFAKIPQIVESAHRIDVHGTRTSRKGQRLEYFTNIGAHEYRYVEMLQREQIIALTTMRKKRR